MLVEVDGCLLVSFPVFLTKRLTGNAAAGSITLFVFVLSPLFIYLFIYLFSFSSFGEWGKIKLELTTLPRIFIRVVCRFNSVAFAAQR